MPRTQSNKRPSADQAITLLKQLKDRTSPAMLAYWVTPNTILTLSGARAFCDGVFYGPRKSREKWCLDIDRSLDIMSQLVSIYASEVESASNPAGEDFAGYLLVTEPGLDYSLRQTNLVDIDTELLMQQENRSWSSLITNMQNAVADAKLPDIATDQMENDVAFGILLGYPDKAMLSTVPSYSQQDSFRPRLIDADIKGADYYPCPQPVYSYTRELVRDTQIIDHEALWSQILQDYYTSDFHKGLEQDKSFADQCLSLGRY